MAYLTLSLLGQFEVTLDGKPLARLGTDKTRALLVYLAVEADRAHRREMLAGLLWPDRTEAAALHSLSQALLLLRQALGEKAKTTSEVPPFLLVTRRTLRFNPESNATVDVDVFQSGVAICASAPTQITPAHAQALTEALECYQGDFLNTPLTVSSVAFEEWALFKQTQLHVLAVDALDYLVQHHIQKGQFPLAIRYARQQIALDPLHESAHRQLMAALAFDGRRSEALAHYATCQAMLVQELGIAPSPETTALAKKIRDARTERPTRVDIQATSTAPVLLPPPSPFVGRERELSRLNEALALTLRGQGQVMFITGVAGSGKTILLDAFSRRALATHAKLLVVNSSGNAYTGLGEPYWLFTEILQQLYSGAANGTVLSLSQTSRLEMAHATIAQTLAQTAPDLEHFISGGSQTGDAPNIQQAGLFAQLTRALQAVASHYPLVIVLDDLQWADQNSLNLLFHLARRLNGQRILIVGAFRPDVLDRGYSSLVYLHEQDMGQRHPLVALVNELQSRLGDIQIDLTQSAGQEFIAALVDSEPNRLGAQFRNTLYQHTGGHALFAAELLQGMRTRGDLLRNAQGYWVEGAQIAWHALPARVEALIAERIGQLPPEWQAMLALASVEGEEFTVQVLARVQNLPEAEISRQMSGALNRHHRLVVPEGVQSVGIHCLARYRFRHLLFQKYLYNRLDPVEQAQAHLAVGRALEALYAEHTYEIYLPLARHFELGGETDKAIAYLLQAGLRATHLAAVEEALRLLTRGLALLRTLAPSPEREQQEAELQLALGTALLAKGWGAPERAQASARAYELGRRAGAADQLARSLLLSADLNLARGQLDQVIAIGRQLHNLSQSTHDPSTAILTSYVLGSGFFAMGRLLPARQHLEQVITLCDLYPDALDILNEVNVSVRGRVWLLESLWMLGYPEQAVECSRQAIANAHALGDTIPLKMALGIGELSLRQYRREPQAMRVALHQLTSLNNNTDLGIFQLWAGLFQGWLAAVDDHDPAGLPSILEAIDQWKGAGTLGGSVYSYVLLAEAQLALQQIESALVTLEQSLHHIAATNLHLLEAEVLQLKGEALYALDRSTEAETCFLRAIAVAQKQAAKAWELRSMLSLCRLRQVEAPPEQIGATHQQLATLYAWFSEGWDTPDLQAAGALLAASEHLGRQN